MKKLSMTVSALLLTAAALSFYSCKPTTDNNTDKTPAFTITGADEASTYTQEGNVITLTAEGTPEYVLTGTFEGKIIVKAKGTVLKLNGVTLTNASAPVIDAELKVEIKAEENTENTITTTGAYDENNKIGAINGAKKVEIGGSGKLTVSGSVCHGIKASDMEVKGSGIYTVSGNKEGSAINCNNFDVKAGKTFTLNLKDSKNGIKADKNITILSGNFNLTNLKNDFKTDKNDGEEHKIDIKNAHITYTNVTNKTNINPNPEEAGPSEE